MASNRLIKYILTGCLSLLGFSCATTKQKKAIKEDPSIQLPEEPIRLMYGVPPVKFSEKDIELNQNKKDNRQEESVNILFELENRNIH